jgi:hypothetical protein
MAQDVKAVSARHTDIQQGEVEGRLLQTVKRLLTICCRRHGVPRLYKLVADRLSQLVVVFRKEDGVLQWF